MDARSRQSWPAGRRGDRHRRADLAWRRQAGQLARADRRALRHPPHQPVPIGGLRTTIAGTVDFVPVDELSAPALSERLAEMVIDEAIAEAGIGTPGDFPGPMFLALPPVEMEWPQRLALAAASGANATVGYDDLLRAAASGKFARPTSGSCSAGGREPGGAVRHQGLPGGDLHRLRLGCVRDPAWRRGDPPRRDRCCAGDRDRRLGEPGSLVRFSLLSALSTRNDPPQLPPARSARIATVS